jgi:RNA polymerase sigma-70 factor (ECF subfamily)
MLSDEELMLAIGEGNLGAFEQMVLRHQVAVWNAAYRFLGDAATAEDLTQETFLRIFDGARRYEPVGKFTSYLYRVVTNLCLDHARRRRPAYVDEIPATAESCPSPLEEMKVRERDAAVRNALDRLAPRQRMAVILRYYEGLSGREVASSMGTSVRAVERLLARARAVLEGLLGGLLEE